MRSSVLFCLAFFIASGAAAQLPTDSLSLHLMLEDASQQAELESGADFSLLADSSLQRLGRRLNINRASAHELNALPGISPLLAANIIAYRQRFGAFVSMLELQAVPGMLPELYLMLRAYTHLGGEATAVPLATLFNQGRLEVTHRFERTVQLAQAYSLPDSLAGSYAGGPWKAYTRVLYQYPGQFSLGMVGEKDAGEAFSLSSGGPYWGYDHLSGHIYLAERGALRAAVVGDYTLEWGQGLLFSRGLRFGRGFEPVLAVKAPHRGIRPYYAANETGFLRGAAATVQAGAWELTAMASFLAEDAGLTEDPSAEGLLGSDVAAQSIRRSGLHRTANELAGRSALTERLLGARVAYGATSWQVGVTGVQQQFSRPIEAGDEVYQRFDFAGRDDWQAAVDADFYWRNLNLFAELATSQKGERKAGIVGLMAALSPGVDAAVMLRHLDAGFNSPRGYIFGARPQAVANEQGVYMGIRARLAPQWRLAVFADLAYHPWYRFRVSGPSRKEEYFAQLQWLPNKLNSLLIQLRYSSDARDPLIGDLMGPTILSPERTRRYNARVHGLRTLGPLRLQGRLEYSYARQPDGGFTGLVGYVDVQYRPNTTWQVIGRYTWFDVQDYDARIYTYEHDVPTSFSIAALNGRGYVFLAQLNYAPSRQWEFWLRLRHLQRRDVEQLGSGSSALPGAARTDVSLQARYVLQGRPGS